MTPDTPVPSTRESAAQPREVSADRFDNWHDLDDLSVDDGGKWWWLCSCERAQGGYPYEHAAHRGWGEHRDGAG